MAHLSIDFSLENILKADEKVYATDNCCVNCDNCEPVHGTDHCLCYVRDKMVDIRATCDCFTKREW